MKIISLEAENFKILKAVRVEPTGAVTRIIGPNGSGKSSVLDIIACAFGGGKYSPEMPIRRGERKAEIVVETDEYVITRKWTPKGMALEVKTPEGVPQSGPQTLLDKIYSDYTFDPLSIVRKSPKEQRKVFAELAKIDLDAYERRLAEAMDARKLAATAAKNSAARFAGLAKPPKDLPPAPAGLDQLLEEMQAEREKAAQKQKLLTVAAADVHRVKSLENESREIRLTVEDLERRLENLRAEQAKIAAEKDRAAAAADASQAAYDASPDGDVAAVEARMKESRAAESAYNRAVQEADNYKRHHEAKDLAEKNYDKWKAEVEAIQDEHRKQIEAAEFPVPGLTFTTDGVEFDGIPFSQRSQAEQIRVCVAVGLALNPRLKVLLVRDGSLIDEHGMRVLAEEAEKAGAQLFVERVDNGRETGIHILDGEVLDSDSVAGDAAAE